MTTATAHHETEHSTVGYGTSMPFDAINEPGTYVCNWSGHLLRIPADSVKAGRSPLISIRSTEPIFVTRISSDPFIPRAKARLLASDADLQVNF